MYALTVANADEQPEIDEIRDFAIRIGAGAFQGIGDKTTPEFSAYADMYLLSQSTRMLFGFSLFKVDSEEIPTMSIQSIGIEQNFPMGRGEFFLGMLYNKAYLEKEGSGFEPRKGESFHLGYKLPLKRYQDLVFMLGQQYRPLNKSNPNLITKLSSRVTFARLAMQWYF